MTVTTQASRIVNSVQRMWRTLVTPSMPVEPTTVDDPYRFQPTEEGSGAFGRWTLDDSGLPAYRYEMDQYKDLRARYTNTEGIDRRDHWHQIGNDRVTGLASNDGIVQFYMADRGGIFLNRYEACDDDPPITPIGFLNRLLRIILNWLSRFRARQLTRSRSDTEPPRGAALVEPIQRSVPTRNPAITQYTYGGGFGYIDDGTAIWSTAFRYRPAGAAVERYFGTGYFETAMVYRNIRVNRRVYAPYGNDPLLLADVQIENLSDQPLTLRYYEYWDVNVHQLKLQWFRTGLFAPGGDDERRRINDRFAVGIAPDYGNQAARVHQRRHDQPPLFDEVNGMVDTEPPDVFLADLTGLPASQYVDKYAFFGTGGAQQPDAVCERRDGEWDVVSTSSMPYCLVLRRDVHLQPAETVKLRYAYGAARPDQPLSFLDQYREVDPFTQTMDRWKRQLVYFSTNADPVLQREMAWHTANLLSATVYNEFYGTHLTPQGSAYLYLHGADGAPRDQALFALPLVYVRPDLARDTLRLIMSLTHAESGAIPYSFAGHGFQSDGVGIHAFPSDLDLFFLLALAEYLSATGDTAFLDASVPFYQPGPPPTLVHGTTVIDHVRAAFRHLTDCVGIGENGLIRVGDGDWSDGVVFSAQLGQGADFETSRANGESIPNSQMALYVLPRIAALIEGRDPVLASQMRALLPGLHEAVMGQWNQRWFTRAILRDISNNLLVIDDNRINLEAQPWALISDLAAKNGIEETLVDSITRHLDDPSPIGAALLEGGQVWPAVSQLLTWGYTRSRQDLAWRSFKNHTFAAHAAAFPDVWCSVWSGPDGVCGKGSPTAGHAWASPVTPMTDFPIMNANQDAMALLALIRVCGIEPSPEGDGLIIAPKAPPERFTLDTPLLKLDVKPGCIAGQYRAVVDGSRALHIRLPETAHGVTAVVNSQPVNGFASDTRQIDLTIAFRASQIVPFEVRWQV